jgi:hypothetical protein
VLVRVDHIACIITNAKYAIMRTAAMLRVADCVIDSPIISVRPVGICGCISSTDQKGRLFWVVAAERSDVGRFIVHANQELPAFLELESAIQTERNNHECDCPKPDEASGSNR